MFSFVSIGGNSYTTVLATIYPVSENYEECLATLQFAFRCRNVQNRPHINYLDTGEDQQSRRIAKLQDEISKLKQEVSGIIPSWKQFICFVPELFGGDIEDFAFLFFSSVIRHASPLSRKDAKW
jgi:hypothetical protein